jgi:hypothetical protein
MDLAREDDHRGRDHPEALIDLIIVTYSQFPSCTAYTQLV